MLHELFNALEETLFMVFAAGLAAWIIGLPLGLLLYSSGAKKIMENFLIHLLLKFFIGTTRSIPYVALSIALIPCTQFMIGFNTSSCAAILPLSLIGTLHFAHYCDRAFYHIPLELIESTKAIGASRLQIICKVLIPEALPYCIQGFGVTLVHLIGYSTIAGALGSGGLGYLLTYKGYDYFQVEIVFSVMFLLVILVQIVQRCTRYIGNQSINSYPTY